MVKVTCGTKFKKTPIKKKTNNPVFDEVSWNKLYSRIEQPFITLHSVILPHTLLLFPQLLVFKFKQLPVELFEKTIELKVTDTERSYREAEIGSFKVCNDE